VYGTLGTPATVNIPGSRLDASAWTDSSGNLWLFGGEGFDANGNLGYLNDVWRYQP
jgi:N-acetylneuraminic acid mutarotase